jgi:hypothetical protein
MDNLSPSFLDGNSCSSRFLNQLHHGLDDDGLPWLGESDQEDDDDFKTDDSPLKRRQRRRRLHSLHCYVARTTVAAVATSASMLTRHVEHMARVDSTSHLNEGVHGSSGIFSVFWAILANFKSSLGQSIGHTSARVSEVATSLANAIGEPPPRLFVGREDQDAPLLMFWTINLCAICIVASIVLFFLAFAVSPVSHEAVDELQLCAQNPLHASCAQSKAVDSKKPGGTFRVLTVIVLSLVSGCGLGLRHPVQSALLCGS